MLGILLDLLTLSLLNISKNPTPSVPIGLSIAGNQLPPPKKFFFFQISFSSIVFFPFSQSLSPHLPVLLFLARFPKAKSMTLFYSAV